MTILTLPSAPRVLTLTEPETQLRGRTVLPVAPVWPEKDPAETMDLAADFGELTGGILLDSFTTAAIGCTVTDGAVSGTLAIIRATGGVDGTPSAVLISAAFGGGEVRMQLIQLPIIAQAPASMTLPTPVVWTTVLPAPAQATTTEAALRALLVGLPTALPATPGQLWLNSGILSVS